MGQIFSVADKSQVNNYSSAVDKVGEYARKGEWEGVAFHLERVRNDDEKMKEAVEAGFFYASAYADYQENHDLSSGCAKIQKELQNNYPQWVTPDLLQKSSKMASIFGNSKGAAILEEQAKKSRMKNLEDSHYID